MEELLEVNTISASSSLCGSVTLVNNTVLSNCNSANSFYSVKSNTNMSKQNINCELDNTQRLVITEECDQTLKDGGDNTNNNVGTNKNSVNGKEKNPRQTEDINESTAKSPPEENKSLLETNGMDISKIDMSKPIGNDVVIGMFNTLLNSMGDLKKDLSEEIKQLKREQSKKMEEVDSVRINQVNQSAEIQTLKNDNKQCKKQLDKLTDLVEFQSQMILELQEKVEMFEKDKVRPNLIVKGIKEDEENCVAKAKSFFKNQMNLVHDIHIRSAHRVGRGKNRPMKIVLVNASDKGHIYSNVCNLQGKKSANGKPFKIDDQLPARLHECKQKNQHFIWKNKRSTAEKIALSVRKGELLVDGQPHAAKLAIPDDQKLIKLKPDEVEELNKINVTKGGTEEYQGSTFTGYACAVQSFKEVNAAYEWVHFHNMNARHIVCACKIPGTNVLECSDFADHDEHGAGQRLLSFMDEADLDNTVVFVVRYYKGVHIGPKRFDIMERVAKSAINHKPYNKVSEKFQFSWATKKAHSRGGLTGGPPPQIASKVGSTASDSSWKASWKADSEVSFDAPRKGSTKNWADVCANTQTEVI